MRTPGSVYQPGAEPVREACAPIIIRMFSSEQLEPQGGGLTFKEWLRQDSCLSMLTAVKGGVAHRRSPGDGQGLQSS